MTLWGTTGDLGDEKDHRAVSSSSGSLTFDSSLGSLTSIDGVSEKVFVKADDSDDSSWALVMKLSKNDFCYDSSKWTDGKAFNPNKMLDDSMPGHRSYDAKSIAFHEMKGVTALRFQTARGGDVIVKFEAGATPENLMTTNDVQLSEYPDWGKWKAAFGSDRNRAPMFVRAGQVVKSPAPICRNSNIIILGCGKPCMFCMMAGDGGGCPTSGGRNDITSGMGGNAAFCGSGDGNRCSTGGHWSGDNAVRIYALVPPAGEPSSESSEDAGQAMQPCALIHACHLTVACCCSILMQMSRPPPSCRWGASATSQWPTGPWWLPECLRMELSARPPAAMFVVAASLASQWAVRRLPSQTMHRSLSQKSRVRGSAAKTWWLCHPGPKSNAL